MKINVFHRTCSQRALVTHSHWAVHALLLQKTAKNNQKKQLLKEKKKKLWHYNSSEIPIANWGFLLRQFSRTKTAHFTGQGWSILPLALGSNIPQNKFNFRPVFFSLRFAGLHQQPCCLFPWKFAPYPPDNALPKPSRAGRYLHTPVHPHRVTAAPSLAAPLLLPLLTPTQTQGSSSHLPKGFTPPESGRTERKQVQCCVHSTI